MSVQYIKKNSGRFQKFNVKKLEHSILAALRHAGIEDAGAFAKRFSHEVREYVEGSGAESIGADAVRTAVLHVIRQHRECASAAPAYELSSLHIKKTILTNVVKRSGRKEPFHPVKLFKSLKKSFALAGQEGGKKAEELTKEIIGILEKEYSEKPVPGEEIRRVAAQLLKEKGYTGAEKFYLLRKYL
jgi:transcriptional regulator NrdR family protein